MQLVRRFIAALLPIARSEHIGECLSFHGCWFDAATRTSSCRSSVVITVFSTIFTFGLRTRPSCSGWRCQEELFPGWQGEVFMMWLYNPYTALLQRQETNTVVILEPVFYICGSSDGIWKEVCCVSLLHETGRGLTFLMMHRDAHS